MRIRNVVKKIKSAGIARVGSSANKTKTNKASKTKTSKPKKQNGTGFIRIHEPYLTHDGNLVRLNCLIDENGEENLVYTEVEQEYAEYLCTERADAYVLLTLPIAIREGFDIHCDIPVTEVLMHNLNEVLIPTFCLADDRFKEAKVIAEPASELIGGTGVGTGMSCGVDSMYTLQQYMRDDYPDMKLTHLLVAAANKELWNDMKEGSTLHDWERTHPSQFKRLEDISAESGLPIVKMYSNFVYYLCKHGRGTKRYRHVFLHTFLTMAMVLTLKKLWGVYYFSSGRPFTTFTLENCATISSSKFDLLNVHAFTTPDFICYSGGARADKIEKTLSILDFDLGKRFMHTCDTRDEKNCSEPTCTKCSKALLTYDAYDRLDDVREIFDVDKYLSRKDEFMDHLYACKDNEYLVDLYGIFLDKYPEQMAQVAARHEKEEGRVKRKDGIDINKWYTFENLLLKRNNPKRFLKRFFSGKGIRSIVYTGDSAVGQSVIAMLKHAGLKCELYNGSGSQDLRNCLAISADDKSIEAEKKQLEMAGATNVYTLNDIFDYAKKKSRRAQ